MKDARRALARLVAMLVVAGAAAAVALGGPAARSDRAAAAGLVPGARADVVVVRPAAGLGAAGRARFLRDVHGVPIAGTRSALVRVGNGGVRGTLARLRADRRVAVAEPDRLRHVLGAPNDPLYASTQKPYLSTVRLPQAWDVTHGGTPPATPVIAVLDSGVNYMEEDFYDGLGFDDPLSHVVQGYDAVNHDGDPQDDFFSLNHGTAVASIASALTNNGKGIAGAGWNARLMPVKVLRINDASVSDSTVAEGIAWAVDHGATVLNLSFGGLGDSDVLEQALQYAESRNAVIVAAAGDSASSAPQYPAASPEPGALAVSATDADGDFAYFSSFGPWVDVAAPGIDVNTVSHYSLNGYQAWTGTSMAAPIVAGSVALVQAQHPTWTAQQVVDDVKAMARDKGPKGPDPYYGAGLLDAYAAVTAAHKQGPMLPPTDNNNTRATASPLGDHADGTISPEGDVDWYSVQVKTPGNLALSVSSPAFDEHRGPNTNLVLAVYDSNGALLRSRDSVPEGHGESVVAPAATAGKYYLTVANYGGERSAGNYTVTARMLPFYAVEAVGASGENNTVVQLLDSGDMLGARENGNDPQYAVWHQGAWQDIADPNVIAMNAAGHVLYYAPDNRCPGFGCPAVDTGGASPLDLDPLWDAHAINASDHVIGTFPDDACGGCSRAAVWRDGVATPLASDASAPGGDAIAINDHDQIVGNVFPGSGPVYAFSWKDGKLTKLPTVSKCPATAAAINDAGTIAGQIGRPGQCAETDSGPPIDLAVWNGGKLTVVPSMWTDAGTDVAGIDDAGEVAGFITWNTVDKPFLYTHGIEIELHDLLPEAFQQWETQHVRGMNASGQIAVQAVDPTGHYRGLILTPLS